MGEEHLKTYIATLATLALTLAASWIYWYGLPFDLRIMSGTVIFAGFVLLGNVFSVRVDEQNTIGTWDIGLIAAVAILGPTWAAAAAIPSAIFEGKRDWLRTAYVTASNITVVYLAGIVFSFASKPLLIEKSESPIAGLYGTFVAGVVLLVANEVINDILLKIKYNQPFRETWREVAQPYLISDAINVLTAGIGVLAFAAYGPAAAMVVIAGAMGSRALVYRSREQVKQIKVLQERVESLEGALASSNMTFASMMIRDMGRRDGYTHRHAVATAVYARDLAQEMRLEDAHVGRLRIAGLLHNIGLFGLPEELLLQTGKLNSIAQEMLAEHPVRGEEALASVPEFKEMARWVRWHHERPDGRGYPDKLRGPWIPLEARILAVAQAYAAMILDQPRRPGIGFAEARKNLVAGVDTEFDGVVVRAFLRILDTETEGYRMADDHRFAFPDRESGERLELGTQKTQNLGSRDAK